ncbi:MAG TPA: PepSY domain-containing protein [Burkholderiales bacterium]|nr:PepSY domain-containing protein [Burkholderiales bacterium]
MRVLVFVHRWLGVLFCLFFAMWFASGLVMHFVPFPALSEAERVAGLAPIDAAPAHGPAAAVNASGISSVTRVRLLARPDGAVYIVQGASLAALYAADLSPAAVRSETAALAIALDHARRRGLNATGARFVELAAHDQWTVPNALDPHRPLYRIALPDDAGTELYVSSVTGEIVRDTTRTERAWNYVGAVVHWIYPTILRSNWRAWDATVWTLSLAALVGAIAGAVLGVIRLRVVSGRLVSPYGAWQAWHHWLGVGCMVFLLTWIFSGWLSMDHGRLFSKGAPSRDDAAAAANGAAWAGVPASVGASAQGTREIEWFSFDGKMYRRERLASNAQRMMTASEASASRPFLTIDEMKTFAAKLTPDCSVAVVATSHENYPVVSAVPGAPVYRIACGERWLHVDGANGALLETLDASRRAYRWLYSALHTLDFPALTARPPLHTALIVTLCVLGFAFSVTAVAIAWRRLRVSVVPR